MKGHLFIGGDLKRNSSDALKQDIIGKKMTEIVPGIEKTDRYPKYLKVLETGKSIFLEEIVANPKFGDRILSVRA